MDDYKVIRMLNCILICANVIILIIALRNMPSIIGLVLTIVLTYLVGKTDGMNDSNHFIH